MKQCGGFKSVSLRKQKNILGISSPNHLEGSPTTYREGWWTICLAGCQSVRCANVLDLCNATSGSPVFVKLHKMSIVPGYLEEHATLLLKQIKISSRQCSPLIISQRWTRIQDYKTTQASQVSKIRCQGSFKVLPSFFPSLAALSSI